MTKKKKFERLSDLGEEGLIERLRARFEGCGPKVIKSIGDDACVAAIGPGAVVLATVDTLVEGIHFQLSYTPARLLGRKALAISISDIAAMGASPVFCLVSLAVPATTTVKFIDALYDGISEVAGRYSVAIAGGNCSRMPGRVVIETTVVGSALPGRVVYRNGARPGDVVYVSGNPGDAALGLKVLRRRGALRGGYKNAVAKHLDPTPRIELGAKLSAGRIATAMIDVSDGLYIDLERLCKSSGVAATVVADKLPLSADMARYPFKSARARLGTILGGGEDYELVFTAARKDAKKIKRLSEKIKLPVTEIGEITGPSVHGRVRVEDGARRAIENFKAGFVHF